MIVIAIVIELLIFFTFIFGRTIKTEILKFILVKSYYFINKNFYFFKVFHGRTNKKIEQLVIIKKFLNLIW